MFQVSCVLWERGFREFVGGSNVSTRVYHTSDSGWIALTFGHRDGQYQDLIMWGQLTDQARAALELADFGDETKVLFNDKHFEASLVEAFPFYIQWGLETRKRKEFAAPEHYCSAERLTMRGSFEPRTYFFKVVTTSMTSEVVLS
ncbi:hypothetical protein V7S43_018436 [Phytophthora oleae]|uniref:Uncharacterized protein n=1 Tax=Phytophthora oleae TaxID=2107226 RepID=A0ABD3EQE0_9STRA